MDHVTIYGRASCGFCVAAKRLCEARGFDYTWIDMVEKGMSKDDIAAKVGHPVYTVPQILVGDRYVGGYDQFSAFVREQESSTSS